MSLLPALDAASTSASGPVIAVELRPPAAEVAPDQAVEQWIDLHHVLRTLAAQGRYVFVTDNAVGKAEEENLLAKKRAAAAGMGGLTVVGGDRDVGPPRCVAHAFELREKIREATPDLLLGGWANPHRTAAEQAGFLTDPRATADFYLTQVVTHHNVSGLGALVRELEDRGSSLQGLAGIFHFRSPNRKTLERLAGYFPVPVEALVADFESGLTPEELQDRYYYAWEHCDKDMSQSLKVAKRYQSWRSEGSC